jgi:hypothetical protein
MQERNELESRRITRVAIAKSMLENGVPASWKCVKKIADEVFDWVWEAPDVPTDIDPACEAAKAEAEKRPEPTEAQRKIIEQVVFAYAEFNKSDNYVVDSDLVVNALWKKFGKYPENPDSVKKIINAIPIAHVLTKKEDTPLKDM